MVIEVSGIDLGKTVCSFSGLDTTGAVVFRKRLQRHGCWTFWKVWSPALLRWRLAAASITLVVFAFKRNTSLD